MVKILKKLFGLETREAQGNGRAAELLAVKEELAAELAAMTRLHELGTRLLASTGLQPLLEEILDATIALLRADLGNVQLYNSKTKALEIVAHRGFRPDFLNHFRSVKEEGAACGRALHGGARTIIEDVLLDPAFAPHRAIAASAGFRAVQSTSLFSRSGEPLGMISTHFRQPHRPSDQELRLTDLYARLAAEMIERRRADDEQRKLAALVENSSDFIGISTPDGQALFVNPIGKRIVGLEGDVGATLIFDYVIEEDRLILEEQVLPTVRQDCAWQGEMRFRHFQTGASIPMWAKVFFIKNAETGAPLALATISRDITERKKVEAALMAAKEEAERRAREAEEAQSILHTIMQNAPEGITMTGGPPDFPIIANSKHAGELLRREASSLLNIASGWHAEAYGILLPDGVTRPRPEQMPLYRACRHGEVIENEELIVERPDGSQIHTLFNVAPIRDSQGAIIGAINCWRDITALKRAEERLREYEKVVEGLEEMIVVVDCDYRYRLANRAFLTYMGLTRDQLDGRLASELLNPGVFEQIAREKLDECLQGKVVKYELRYNYPKHGERDLFISYFPIEGPGGIDRVACVLQDVTERKRSEMALRRSEATLAEGQRLSHTASWVWNVSTGEAYWSAELFRIYGLDPEKEKPACPDVLKYIHPEDRSRVQKTFEEAVREEREYELAYRVVWSGGTIRHVNNLAHPVFNEAGALIEYVGTTNDTTQRIQAEEAMQKLQAELTHVTRVTTMGELAASIAHEINQPLGAIVNNSTVLLRLVDAASGLPGELREILSDVVQDANRASAIVARIRAMTKWMLPEKTSLQLRAVITDVLALAHHELAERRIQVVTELPEDLPWVLGDRVQLQQVLLNLVMNGIEAMSDVEDKRRFLTIGGQRDELDGQPFFQITVRDLGSGFRPEDSERLFEAFYTTKPHGMGMGLRISRSIVEAHGGRLWPAQNAGPGMTFSCALPIQNPDAS